MEEEKKPLEEAVEEIKETEETESIESQEEQEDQEETSDEIERFIGTYTKDFGSYKEALILGVGKDRGEFDGLFYYEVGNSYHGGWSTRTYTEYSINGNELAGTKPFGEIEGYVPDTFVLNEDGSITATFPDRDFYNGVYERNDGYDETEEYPGGYP